MKIIIAFSGTDGAGKSTQIELLEKYLSGKGIRSCRFWARGGYTPIFSLMKNLLRKLRGGSLPGPGKSVARQQRFESPHVRKLWLVVSILDLLLFYGIWLRLKRSVAYTVICDRYIEDTLLDFRANFPQEKVESWALWRLLVKLSPEPDNHFLLIVPPEESSRRSKLKNEPFPDSPEVLNWRYNEYCHFGKAMKWEVVDCMKSVDTVHRHILAKLGI